MDRKKAHGPGVRGKDGRVARAIFPSARLLRAVLLAFVMAATWSKIHVFVLSCDSAQGGKSVPPAVAGQGIAERRISDCGLKDSATLIDPQSAIHNPQS